MTDLPQRELGRTGLMVTALGYGSLELRNDARGRRVSEKQAERVLNSVLDLGINLIDTSIDYGLSEERIGRYISHRRPEFFLATKCGCPLQRRETWSSSARRLMRRNLANSRLWQMYRRLIPWREGRPSVDDHSFSRENIISGVEQSLRRMKTDYIDILQVHHAPPLDVLEELGAIETLLDLKQQGKVRFIGVSAGLPVIADYITRGGIDVVQVPYSAFGLDTGPTIAAAAAAGIGTVIRSGIGSGGRGGLAKHPGVRDAWRKAGLDRLAPGMSRAEFNLRFTLGNSDVDTVLMGTATPAHLTENVNAVLKGPLPEELMAEVTAALAGLH